MNFDLIFRHAPDLLRGVWTTLWLTGSSLAVGLVLAVICAVILTERIPVLEWLVRGFVYVFRGTPLLVQLYLVYYGLSQFPEIRRSFLWPWLREPWFCALLVFALNTAAYTTEILRGAIANLRRGELEAAVAYGMSPFTRLRRIVLPAAFRQALPQYSNEVVFMLHGSAIASVITIQDILGVGRTINARYYVTYEGFVSAAVLYLAVTFVVVAIFRQLEKRLMRHLAPVAAPR
ncbi:ABC transporter permease [Neomegalonema perideroedes]|uniref:ABC transporter permease n=1 Tax=Neomegalonema perideroedes TaxID=217219 RepID=UPI00037142AC|nr:ABC transporter permease subunit [Neomegalonema perideroedes]